MRRRTFLAATAAVISATARAQARPLRVVLLPFTDTMALMRMYQPLRSALGARLGRPVELFTAADFSAHFADIRKGDFDLAITGPHFGAWAVEHGHRPVLRYKPTLRPLVVVRKDSGITDVSALRGRVVALSNRLSVSSIAGEAWLASMGLRAGRDYRLQVSPTHTTAIMAVALGEVDAAITTHTPIRQAPEDVRGRLATIESPAGVPHLFTIANAAMPAAEAAAVRQALLDFAATAEGKAFLADSGYQDYVDITAADVAAMAPVIEVLTAILAEEGA
ncbi:MAG: phosphate/phosphite/phosphonate ABC transporter substrate-binding protein [Pseudomonadota bacterium]